MGKYLKKFENHTQYEEARQNLILPNVSYIKEGTQVLYEPYVEPIETRVVAKFNVTSTSSPTKIGFNNYTSGFSAIEIDGVQQSSVASAYTFSTTGVHTVKYTLTDPTTVGTSAFYNCSSLTSIDIPSGVTNIGKGAFQNCSGLTSIDIPSGVTNIGQGAFSYCTSLTSIDIPGGVTTIGGFSNCSSLTSVTIGSGAKYISSNAFNGCKSLTSVGPTGSGASLEIPNSVIAIYDAFSFCTSLTSVNIPSGVTSIGSGAFRYCTSLTSCVIGSGVTSIGSQAFSGCTSIASITSLRTSAPTIQNDTFRDVKTNGTLYVPQGSSGYNTWMGTGNYYLGKYNWTKVEQ